ncbi:GNAT family N-acetyltransferase [Rhodobacteraceae bacterium B1Z28]|uniref:GNAT family N-acetyltransferase n=1 Tax=Ruegeria haliotis TaxID=2747601 RepID=A0ABX2PWR2_9RHOB|nr:GNAT family N-acetyltransferase [Ruegeria haliotis]NVO58643.1 GNAT family N-acetyltransferase [Ruegeria haliotis]
MTDPDKTPWLIPSDGFALYDALALLRVSFQFMDGRIDPPSSVHRLTVEGMQAHCYSGGEIWAIGRPLFACMFLTPKSDSLYLGKLAVKEGMRGQGICRTLVDHAAIRAAELGLPALELETRVELAENHRAFSRLGFTIVSTGSHDGYGRPTDFLLRKSINLSADS